jgi:hypothetical protein
MNTPAIVDFGTLAQGNPTPAAPLTLNLFSTVNADWTITSDQPWLTVDRASGTTPSPVQVSVNPDAMALDVNSAMLTITWATVCTKQISVQAVITASSSTLGLTRFARFLPSGHKPAPAASINAGTPGPVEAVDFAILVEVQTVKP